MKKILTVFALLILTTSFHCFPYANEGIDNQELRQVVEDFRVSLIEKDEAKFVELFYSKSIPWLGIEAKENRGSLPTNSGIQQGNHLRFIGWIVRTPERMEEKFWDIQIQTDGLIASINFKYSFHEGSYKSNWGEEYWQLIKTESGWKINSIIYSVINNPKPRDVQK